MGLARLVNRSSPNVAPVARAAPVTGPTQFMAGPEQGWPPAMTLPATTESQAMSVPAFWRGCAYVCGTVGALPCTVFRGTDALTPQPSVVQQPDPNQTPMAFWCGVTESLALYGNSICIITQTDRNGWPLTLKPIHPTLAAVRFTGNPMAPEIAAWYVAGQIYDPSEIWHVKSHLGRAGWPLGRGVITSDSDAIATSTALQAYSASYFNAGGMPTGILKIHRPEITQEQADTAKSAWISKFAGTPSVAVMNELTDFTPVAFRPVDSQMIESRQFELLQVALLWGVPPSKLGANVGSGTYKNAEMEEVQARNDGVAPWTRLLEQAGSIELLPRGQHLQWDLSAHLRADTLSLFQAYNFALGGPGPTSAWMLRDEIRARENMDPMAIVQHEIDQQVAAVLPTAEPPEAPPMPRLPGGPPTGGAAAPPMPQQLEPAASMMAPANGKGP